MPRIELERREEVDERADRTDEAFDRLTFAEHAVSLVRPEKTTVAICMGSPRVTLEAGRRWGHGADARWAVLSFPRDASRSAIARAVLGLSTLAGVGSSGPRPWTLDVLLADLDSPRS